MGRSSTLSGLVSPLIVSQTGFAWVAGCLLYK